MVVSARALLAAPGRPARLAEAAAFVCGLLATLFITGYFGLKRGLPASVGGDHLFSMSMAKSYLDGHGFRFNPQLGFPSGQDNLYFPSFDLLHRLILWLAARVAHSPAACIDLMYLVGLSAMFGCAFWALRRFEIRPWLAAVGAVATVATPYLAMRAYGHDFLALSFSAPLGLGLALSLADRRLASLKGFLSRPFTVAAILIVGAGGLYYAFFSLMFVAFVAVAASLGQRRWLPLFAGVAAGAPLLCVVVVSGYGLDLPQVLSGQFAGPVRAASDQLYYGLDLPAAAYAFSGVHKIAWGVDLARQSMPMAFANEGVGEWPAWPLTLVIVSAPLLAAVSNGRRPDLAEGGPDRLGLIGWAALCLTFGLLFGARGGLGFLFNLTVTSVFRGDSRLMPFLVVGAVLILCLAAEMAAAARPRALRLAGPALVALLFAASVVPSFRLLETRQRQSLEDPGQQALTASVRGLLKAKDQAHLGVFLQLPQVKWPEAPPIRGFDPYQHLLPYLFDAPGSGARWSYGSHPSQRQAALLAFVMRDGDQLAARARAFGFDGVIIQKAAYEPAALAALQATLARQLGPACRVYDDAWASLYALKPGSAHGC